MRDEVLGILPCWVLTELKMVVRILLHRSCHPFRWWPVQSAILSSMPFPLPCQPFWHLSRPSCHSFLLCPVHPAIPFCFFTPPSCHPFRWWPVQSTILSSLVTLFPLPCHPFRYSYVHPVILFFCVPSIQPFLSVPSPLHPVILFASDRPACHPVISFNAFSHYLVSPFLCSHVHPVILFFCVPSILLFLSVHPSILSSLFDGVPSILSSFFAGNTSSLPSCHLFLTLSPFLFHFSLVHPVISFRRWTVHPVIPFCSPLHLVIPFCLCHSFSFLTRPSCHLIRRWTIHPVIPFCSLTPPSCHPFLLPLASPSCQTV